LFNSFASTFSLFFSITDLASKEKHGFKYVSVYVLLSCLAVRHGGHRSVLTKPSWVQIATNSFLQDPREQNASFKKKCHVHRGCDNFNWFSPAFRISPSFHQVSPGFHQVFTKFSPSFHEVFTRFQNSPEVEKIAVTSLKHSQGSGKFTKVFDQVSKFHQVFTRFWTFHMFFTNFRNFTRFWLYISPSISPPSG
jgi:hypothetical protein